MAVAAVHLPRAAPVAGKALTLQVRWPVETKLSQALVAKKTFLPPSGSLVLYYALCAFRGSTRRLIPTAISTEEQVAGDDWATGVCVTVHDSDLEDARLLAVKCDVGDHVSTCVDSGLQPSSCYSSICSISDANANESSRFRLAEGEMKRCLELGDVSNSELIFVESGSSGRLGRGAGAAGSMTALDSSLLAVVASELPLLHAPATDVSFSLEVSEARLPSSLSELWVGVPPPALAHMLRKVGMLLGLLPGAPVRVFALAEETLIKHLPPGEGLGRLRVYDDTAMVADTAGHPRESEVLIAAISATGQRFRKVAVATDAALRPDPDQIAPGGSRSCSFGALLQIGEGAASVVLGLGSGHGLEFSRVGRVTLEDTTQAPVDAARDGVELTALACVNPGRCAVGSTPYGIFATSVRAEPGASPGLPQQLVRAQQCWICVANIALYGLPSGMGDPPHAAADMQLLPHLACALPVRDVIRPVPCLPPYAAYSGIVLVTGANVSQGSGPRKLRVIGYAVKTMEVPDPTVPSGKATVQVITYFAAPESGIAPYERDSGGGVYQVSAVDGSFVLHSFVCARSVLTDPATGLSMEFYTLTPAHLALEQVHALQSEPGSTLPQGALRFVVPR